MLRPWDQSSVLAACDGEAVRLPVCERYETLKCHRFCRAGSLTRLNASLVLAYIVLGCYVGGISSWLSIAPRDAEMPGRSDQNIDQLSANIHRLHVPMTDLDPAQEGQNPSKSFKVPFC